VAKFKYLKRQKTIGLTFITRNIPVGVANKISTNIHNRNSNSTPTQREYLLIMKSRSHTWRN